MFTAYKNDESGNVAIMFSVALLLLLGGVGAAVDMSQMVSNKQKVADIAAAGKL